MCSIELGCKLQEEGGMCLVHMVQVLKIYPGITDSLRRISSKIKKKKEYLTVLVKKLTYSGTVLIQVFFRQSIKQFCNLLCLEENHGNLLNFKKKTTSGRSIQLSLRVFPLTCLCGCNSLTGCIEELSQNYVSNRFYFMF